MKCKQNSRIHPWPFRIWSIQPNHYPSTSIRKDRGPGKTPENNSRGLNLSCRRVPLFSWEGGTRFGRVFFRDYIYKSGTTVVTRAFDFFIVVSTPTHSYPTHRRILCIVVFHILMHSFIMSECARRISTIPRTQQNHSGCLFDVPQTTRRAFTQMGLQIAL